MSNTEKIGYLVQKTSSEVLMDKGTADLQAMADFIGKGWIILWQHHAVFAIEVQSGSFKAPVGMAADQSHHLVRARAFGENKEWHVWREEDGLKGRQRIDLSSHNEGETTYIETQMRLRGMLVHQMDSSQPDEDWVLHTRNYIGFSPYHLAGYDDSMFLSIEKVGKESQL